MSQGLKQPDKIRVSINELTDVGLSEIGSEIYHYENKPFSGYLVWDYYPSGIIMYEEEFKEGENIGWENEYDEEGKLKRSTLVIGLSSIQLLEYDNDGNELITGDGLLVPKESFDKLVEKYNLLD